jgi:hypothetical protein
VAVSGGAVPGPVDRMVDETGRYGRQQE